MAETLLNVKNLTKKFEGHTILDGMDLEIKQGRSWSKWMRKEYIASLYQCIGANSGRRNPSSGRFG